MKVINKLPAHYIEHDYFGIMMKEFDPKVFKDKIVYITHNYNKIGQTGKNVVAIVTAGDEKGGMPSWSNKVGLIFKHQFDPTVKKNCYHIPLPYVNDFKGTSGIPILERKYDAFFIGRNLQHRQHAKRALLEFREKTNLNVYIKFTHGFMKGLDPEEYADIMSNTKIALSLHGAKRPECLRFSEAVKCGCAIIACDHPQNHFFKNCPATYVNNKTGWQDIENLIASYTPEKLVETSERMKNCWRDFFSPEAVGKYINKIVKEKS